MPKDKLLLLFTKHLSRNGLDNTTKLWIITAMSKMVVCDVLTADIYTMPIEQLITLEDSVIVKQVTDIFYYLHCISTQTYT